MKVKVFVKDIHTEKSYGIGRFVQERKETWEGPRDHICITVIPVIKDENGPQSAQLATAFERDLYPELYKMSDGSPTRKMMAFLQKNRVGKIRDIEDSNRNPFDLGDSRSPSDLLDDLFFDKIKGRFLEIDYDVSRNRFDIYSLSKIAGGSAQYEHLIPKPMFDDETPEEVHQ
jgi:hypothetical protein